MMILNPWVIYDISHNIFEAVFDTTKTSTGSSDANSVKLPLTNMDGLVVDWGDGVINSSNTHTYASSGIKNVKIEGTISGWSYNNTGDRLKLTEIKSWGIFNISLTRVFFGCENLTLTNVIGVPIISSSSLTYSFSGCTLLNKVNNMNLWDVSNVVDFSFLFNSCTNFNQNIGAWNVGNANNTGNMFASCTNFNQNIGGWNVGNVNNMSSMFYGCTNFNQNIGGWNVANVNNMNSMFAFATNFNQDISNWNIRNVSTYGSFMFGKNSSNYNATYLTNIYNKWSLLTPVKTGITINFGSIKYTTAGQAGRDILTTTYGWTITDGGI